MLPHSIFTRKLKLTWQDPRVQPSNWSITANTVAYHYATYDFAAQL